MTMLDTRHYERRWGRKPDGRSEVWAVMGPRAGCYVYWFKGPFSHLERHLGPGQWTLLAPAQFEPDRDPRGFARRI